MFEGWTASVELSGASTFAHTQAAKTRSDVQTCLAALARPINLRHVDDQAVAALAAILNAIGPRELAGFRNDAIVASSRAIGKIMLAASMQKNETEGAWGVSPQIIPNGSLHSVSGLLSVALGMIGPNIGAGGVHEREGEGFLAALSLLGEGIASRVWVVLTGVDDVSCRAVAILLNDSSEISSECAEPAILSLCIDDALPQSLSPLTLESLYEVVTTERRGNCHWSLPGGTTLAWRVPMIAEAAA